MENSFQNLSRTLILVAPFDYGATAFFSEYESNILSYFFCIYVGTKLPLIKNNAYKCSFY